MTAPVTASERDLRALAAIVSEDRADLPADEGLPASLLADLMGQIRCDAGGYRWLRRQPADNLVRAGRPVQSALYRYARVGGPRPDVLAALLG